MRRNKTKGTGLLLLALALFALMRIGANPFHLVKTILTFGILGVVLITALIVLLFVLSQKNKNEKGNSEANKSAPNVPHTNPTIKTDDLIHLGADDAAAIRKGRENLMNLRRIIVKISNPQIRAQANDICGIMDKILQTLRTKPDQINDVRQFLNYYMPTLREILRKYETIEEGGVAGGEMTAKVSTYLGQIKQAMDKQYENLFEDDKLDLRVEMEAMTMACKQDGLLEDPDAARIDAGEQGITLTL